MTDLIEWPTVPFDLEQSLVLVGRRGSESHGLYVDPADPRSIDDRDLIGVVVPPRSYYLGMNSWEGAEAIKGCWDVVLYELRKFVRLAVKQNPNVLCLLWLHPDDYLAISPAGKKLIEARDLFRHRDAAYNSFVGYAHGQLRRMTHFSFAGYMGEKRKALVEKYGYDTKNAAHLIRILRMGLEYLTTGVLLVRRDHDRDELLSIKRGEWSLDRVKLCAADLFSACELAREVSPLPTSIDLQQIGALVENCISGMLDTCGSGTTLARHE